MAKNKKLVVGNWKMYPSTLTEAKKIFTDFKKNIRKITNTTVVFCPPAIFLSDLKKMYSGDKVFFGVQNIFWDKEGPYTGEISPQMASNMGARFVIVGHSERRALGETDLMVSQKALNALKSKLHTIVCVGERKRDANGNFLEEVSNQLKDSLQGIPGTLIKNLIIAYEPVWAIGKGATAMQPEQIHQMSLYVRKILTEIYGRSLAAKVSILYGGSVDSENAKIICTEGQVDGLLIGRASLNPYEFNKIISSIN